jgi:hypothetical protein
MLAALKPLFQAAKAARSGSDPPCAANVFKGAVPNDPMNPTAWFGRNADGQVYRFSLGNDGTAHFSGINGVGDGTRNLTRYAIDRLNDL